MTRLKDKVALVTGGGVGIGRAVCLALAREGAAVAVTDIDEEGMDQTVSAIEERGGSARAWKLDVRDSEQVKQVFRDAVEHFEGLDILVNNAGVAGPNQPTHEIEEKDWDDLMAVNVKGVFLCTRAAIPYFKQTGGGSIINLSSIYGLVGAPDLPPYHASKGAVRLMSKTDALLYADDGIRVNSVHPGYIWTPLVEKLGRSHPDGVEAFRRELDAKHPLGHVGEPEDIAEGIVYLASDEAKFVTGSELVIDGGYTAR